MNDSRKFRYHKPSPAGVERIETVRRACRALEAVLLESVPDGRERSLALTNLEQVSMWANKGIVLGDPESVVLGDVAEQPDRICGDAYGTAVVNLSGAS